MMIDVTGSKQNQKIIRLKIELILDLVGKIIKDVCLVIFYRQYKLILLLISRINQTQYLKNNKIMITSSKPKRQQKPTKQTKTKLLANGKLIAQGTCEHLDNYITDAADVADVEDKPNLSEYMQVYENGYIYRGSFNCKDGVLRICNIRFDWRKMFGVWVDKRELLREVVLECCQNQWDNIGALASFNWDNLKSLTITQAYGVNSWIRQKMTADGIEQLLANKWPALEKLSLCKDLSIEVDNEIGDEGLESLLSCPFLPKLKHLDVGRNKFSSLGLQPILSLEFSNLTLLALEFNRIGSAGVKMLVKANLQNLQILKLSFCNIRNEGARHLIKGNWPQLHQIRINCNGIGLSGYQSIPLNNWPELKNFRQTLHGCGCCGGIEQSSGIGIEWFQISILCLVACPQLQPGFVNFWAKQTQQFLPIFEHRQPYIQREQRHRQ